MPSWRTLRMKEAGSRSVLNLYRHVLFHSYYIPPVQRPQSGKMNKKQRKVVMLDLAVIRKLPTVSTPIDRTSRAPHQASRLEIETETGRQPTNKKQTTKAQHAAYLRWEFRRLNSALDTHTRQCPGDRKQSDNPLGHYDWESRRR